MNIFLLLVRKSNEVLAEDYLASSIDINERKKQHK